MNLIQFRQNLARTSNREEIYKEVFRIIRLLEAYLVDLQQLQLSEGQNPQGQTIGTYSPATEEFAKQENPLQPKRAGDPYNFEWTGKFFRGMNIKVGKNEAVFTSSDSKTPLLIQQYGQLFGLSDKHLEEAVREKILPRFLEEWRGKLL